MDKNPGTKEYRVWLRPDTITQVKFLALLLNRSYNWNMVLDDVIRMGVWYLNRTAQMELADWKGFKELLNDAEDLKLRIVKGLPDPAEDIDEL